MSSLENQCRLTLVFEGWQFPMYERITWNCHPSKTNVGWHWFSRGDNFPGYPLVPSIFILYSIFWIKFGNTNDSLSPGTEYNKYNKFFNRSKYNIKSFDGGGHCFCFFVLFYSVHSTALKVQYINSSLLVLSFFLRGSIWRYEFDDWLVEDMLT